MEVARRRDFVCRECAFAGEASVHSFARQIGVFGELRLTASALGSRAGPPSFMTTCK